MSEFDSSRWGTTGVNDTDLKMELRPASGHFQIGHRYGSPEDPGHVIVVEGNSIAVHERPINPRSTSIADTGRAVVADWRAYGEPTGSDVTVFEPDGTVAWQTEYDASSPFVAISGDGKYIAISPYNGETRVVEVETDQLVTLHSNKLDNREKPLFVGNEPELHLGRNSGDEPAYAISLTGELLWQSDEFDEHSFLGALTLKTGIDWEETADRLLEAYESGDSDVQRRVTETVSNTSLANLNSEAELEAPRKALTRLYEQVSGDNHKRAVTIPLSDVHYRLARAYKRTRPMQECLEPVRKAITLAEEGLPWYDAKQQLAKCHRFRARLHKQRGNYDAAEDDIERIFELEQKYEIQLASDGDRNLREELVD